MAVSIGTPSSRTRKAADHDAGTILPRAAVHVNRLGLTSRNRDELSHVAVQKPRRYDYIWLPVADAKVIDFHRLRQTGRALRNASLSSCMSSRLTTTRTPLLSSSVAAAGIGFRASPQGILGNDAGILNLQCKQIAACLGAGIRRGASD